MWVSLSLTVSPHPRRTHKGTHICRCMCRRWTIQNIFELFLHVHSASPGGCHGDSGHHFSWCEPSCYGIAGTRSQRGWCRQTTVGFHRQHLPRLFLLLQLPPRNPCPRACIPLHRGVWGPLGGLGSWPLIFFHHWVGWAVSHFLFIIVDF